MATNSARSNASGVRSKRLRHEALESRLMLSVVPPTVTDINVGSTQWTQSFVDHLEARSLGTQGYSIPVGSTIQQQSLPWVGLDQVLVTFSEDVLVEKDDLSISGVASAGYSIDSFFYDPATRIAKWTLATPILAGERVRLDLDGDASTGVRDLDGNVLDGEWTDSVSTFASGDGTAGGDFEFSFNVLQGDAMPTNLVNYFDYIYTRFHQGYAVGDFFYQHRYDIDGSGAIDAADWHAVLDNVWGVLPTGIPTGSLGDAPTTSGFDLLAISDRQQDHIVDLDAAFEDAGNPDSTLTYAIESQSNAALFDAVTINAATGELTINAVDSLSAKGRSSIVVSATDSTGLSVEATLTVDVDYVNLPPVISSFNAVYLGINTWEMTGYVSDPDDDVEGLIVDISGVGASGRAVVRADGSFTYISIISNSSFGYVEAFTVDRHDNPSNSPKAFVGLT